MAPSKNSATGTRTRVARVRAEYPNQLDYSGLCSFSLLNCLRQGSVELFSQIKDIKAIPHPFFMFRRMEYSSSISALSALILPKHSTCFDFHFAVQSNHLFIALTTSKKRK